MFPRHQSNNIQAVNYALTLKRFDLPSFILEKILSRQNCSSGTQNCSPRFLNIEHTELFPRHTELLSGTQLFPGYIKLLFSHADLLPGYKIAPWARKSVLQSHRTAPWVHKNILQASTAALSAKIGHVGFQHDHLFASNIGPCWPSNIAPC